MSAQTPKSPFELTVELIKALAWPLFALFVLISFWQPLHLMVSQFPELVNRSDTITIAGLTIKIDRSLQLQDREPSAEARKALSELTPEGIEVLMGLSGSARWTSQSADSGRKNNAELVRLGLFEEMLPEELTGEYVYGVRVTQLGRDTQEYLYAVISEFVSQLDQSTPTPNP